MANVGADFSDLGKELWVIVDGVGNFLNTVNNSGMIAVAEEKADVFEWELRVLAEEVHGDMASVGDGLSPELTGESLRGDAKVGGDGLKDVVRV